MSTRNITGNQDKLYKGEVKLNPNQKVFETRKDKTPKRKIRINHNTEIYTSKTVSDEEIIREFNERHGLV